ncbi:hypothetical protein LG943_21405 [Streptomonospora sp. S1-112]|uniref:Uncharacterized protein n=1 Tax=Streptomonospora mangrovi TaxID=2883123 RepID=A0A9X3NR87_9ACTN|nr:hypothetical protein [Streptomonospora mangrovi]MDA0566851.1 hypothetical protein [Streptomonospora mangrovi]
MPRTPGPQERGRAGWVLATAFGAVFFACQAVPPLISGNGLLAIGYGAVALVLAGAFLWLRTSDRAHGTPPDDDI